MIVFDLKCAHGHKFEAWFKGSDAYEEQRAAGVIICPVCGDADVSKAPMAPNIASGKGRGEDDKASRDEGPAPSRQAPRGRPASLPPAPAAALSPAGPGHAVPDDGSATHMLGAIAREFHQAMEKVRAHVEENFDYVGDRFAEEARKIHYGEVETRPIYGEASAEESEELHEEGVDVIALPFPAKHDS